MLAVFFLWFGVERVCVGAPQLFLEGTNAMSLRLVWTNTAPGFAVEQTISLYPTVQWALLSSSMGALDQRIELAVTPTDTVGFFRLVSADADRDQDGLSDEFEAHYGFNPDDPDSNHNGVTDGIDDDDGDGVSNYIEMLLGTDPHSRTTFPPVQDNELDRDGDHLPDWIEATIGTDWLNPDTDGDRFTDEAEHTVGTNPRDPRDFPRGFRFHSPGEVIVRRLGGPGATVFIFGQPSVEVVQLSVTARRPTILATPAIEVLAPGRSTNSVPQFIFGRQIIEVSTAPPP